MRTLYTVGWIAQTERNGARAVDAATAAIGIGLGLTIANHSSIATLARNVTAGAAITLSASAVSSATAGDFKPVMGVTLIVGLNFMLVNLVVDLLYGVLDPRLRHA